MKDFKKKPPINMSYNSELEGLIMPEYGRNVQQLVRYAQTIQNDDYRQSFCEEIINLIQRLYPQSRNIEDYREKLWKHLFQIAKYKLNATTPSGIVPTPEDLKKKPQPVAYPKNETKFRHYGSNIRKLIDKAIQTEDEDVRDGLVNTIGSYMKLSYKTWNREHFISDDVIKRDLDTLSDGKLVLEDGNSLDGLGGGVTRNYTRDTRSSSTGRDTRGRDSRSSGSMSSGNRMNSSKPSNSLRDKKRK